MSGSLDTGTMPQHQPQVFKHSPLHSFHQALGAHLGPFGGWELPMYYSSILQEHQVVRKAVGVFDVSHLGHLEVAGSDAVGQLQPLFTQNLARLEPGRAIYSPMLTPNGVILDEMIVYRLAPDRFRLVVNAANGDKVLAWVREHLASGRAAVQDFREKFGTLAVQGPQAVGLVEQLVGEPVSRVPRYSVNAGKIAGRPVLMARTGYTGEDGFELFVATPDLGAVWQTLLEKGKPLGIQPVGLGARDTLRLEAGLPLGGSDLDDTTTPLEAGLDWTIAWDKGPFIGREALERQKQQGILRKLVGFRLQAPGVPRHGFPIHWNGKPVGQVTSGTFLPIFERAIGMGYMVPVAAQPGTAVAVEIRGQFVPAEIVRLPFYRRSK